jgi:hypothetical protein
MPRSREMRAIMRWIGRIWIERKSENRVERDRTM